MSKLQEYFKRKKINDLGLPKLYIVKSTRDGVDKPIERQVIEIVENVSYRGKERLPSDRYKLENNSYPYEVDILRGEKSTIDEGYGTGYGDLWVWSYFSAFSIIEAEEYYTNELKRVNDNYIQKK